MDAAQGGGATHTHVLGNSKAAAAVHTTIATTTTTTTALALQTLCNSGLRDSHGCFCVPSVRPGDTRRVHTYQVLPMHTTAVTTA